MDSDSELDFDDLLQLIALPSDPEACEPPPWPYSGQSFQLVIEVEHIGPGWEDYPGMTIMYCPDDVEGVFMDHTLEELCHKDELPIASGIYVLHVQFWWDHYIDWESGYDEGDYGFTVLSLHKFM